MRYRLTVLLAALLALAACKPQPTTVSDIPGGEALYARHCSACHGQFGEGDGPVAIAMSVTVPNLRLLAQRAGGEFPRDGVEAYIDGRDLPAAHGDRYMPVWGDIFRWGEDESEASEEAVRLRIEALADFLERIQS